MAVNPDGEVALAKALRSCSSWLFIPVVAICCGIIIGQQHGICMGILGGIGCGIGFAVFMMKLIDKTASGLTVVDCLLPLLISIVCGVVFAPIALFSASVFSFATCIYSGLLLSLTLFSYKYRSLDDKYLIMPICVFVYEILPIELPTDLDNIFALGGNTINYYFVLTNAGVKPKSIKQNNPKELDQIDEMN